MTTQEIQRFNEIVFYNYIVHLLTEFNPIVAWDTIEKICLLDGNTSSLQITNLVSNIRSGTWKEFIPTKEERIYLMIKNNTPVRDVTKAEGISQQTYYKYRKQGTMYPIKPVLNDKQYAEVLRFLNILQKMNVTLERTNL